MKFKTQLTAKEIFKFSFVYTYLGSSGILAILMIIIGALMCARAIVQGQGTTYVVLGALIVILFVVVNPIMLYMKAKKQALTNPVYQQPSYYTLKEEGIFVEIGEENGTIEWARVQKIRHLMGLYILYTGRQQAFVFPEEAMGSQKEAMAKYIEEHVEAAKNHQKSASAKEKNVSSSISEYANGKQKKDDEE